MESLVVALLPKKRYPLIIRYTASLAIVGVSFIVRLALDNELAADPFLTFIPAILFSALVFDKGSGFFATFVSAAIAAYVFIPPSYNFAIGWGQVLPLLIFVAVGCTIAATTEALRHAIAKLADTESQQALLLEELAHRTKNDLTMISSVLTLQARGLANPEAKAALDSAVARVGVIARAQDRLRVTGDNRTVEVAAFLEELCSGLGDLLRDVRPIAVRVRAERLDVTSSEAVSIGLIANELVTNALKYAFPDNGGGLVDVDFYRARNGYCLAVTDDGVGSVSAAEGLGSRLVRMLAAQLGGKIEQEAPQGSGCRIRVYLPSDLARSAER